MVRQIKTNKEKSYTQLNREKKKYVRSGVKISDAKCEELGKDLIDWLQNEGKTACSYVRWYHIKHKLFYGDWKDLKLRVSFAPHYELARRIMAENLQNNKNLHPSYVNRYLAMLDPDIDQWEEHKADLQMQRQIKVKEREAQITALGMHELVDYVKKGTLLDHMQQEPKLINEA